MSFRLNQSNQVTFDHVAGKTGRKLTGYPHIDKIHEVGYGFFARHPIIPSISVSNAIDIINVFKRDRIAVECGNMKVTYKELIEDSKVIARSLIELGVRTGDIVPVAMPNLYHAIAVFKGANRIGAITTFLNSKSGIGEIKKYLNEYKSTVFFGYNGTCEYYEEILNSTGVKHIVNLAESDSRKREFIVSDGEFKYDEMIEYNQLKNVSKKLRRKFTKTLFGGKQNALILYTSGSTGEPKSMLFTNENILATCIYLKNSAKVCSLGSSLPKWLGAVPFMYPYGFVPSTIATLLSKRTSIVCSSVDMKEIPNMFEKKPNVVFGSPALLDMIKKGVGKGQDLSSVKIFVSGGDFLYEKQIIEAMDFFETHGSKIQIANSAGNGELLGAMSSGINNKAKIGSVGKLVVGPQYLLLDTETQEPVKYGETGELYCLGKHVFKEYYGRPKKTDEVMVNIGGKKYYRTGNIGFLDEEGYFYLIARASRFYIINTLNKVYCEHVQKIISQIAYVQECAVVPKPDEDILYIGKAYIKLKEGVDGDENTKKDILKQCKNNFVDAHTGIDDFLEPYEIPAEIEFLKEIPRHQSSDKIDYEFLRKKAEEEFQKNT